MIETITLDELSTLLKDGIPKKTVLIDVRSPEEFARMHIRGAINIPHQLFSYRFDELEEYETLILYCRTGNRAEIASSEIELWSHQQILYLNVPGWENRSSLVL